MSRLLSYYGSSTVVLMARVKNLNIRIKFICEGTSNGLKTKSEGFPSTQFYSFFFFAALIYFKYLYSFLQISSVTYEACCRDFLF